MEGVGYGILSRRFVEHAESRPQPRAVGETFTGGNDVARRGRRKHTGLENGAAEAVGRTMGEERNDAPALSSGTRTRRRAARAERST